MLSFPALRRLAVLNFGRRQPFTWPAPANPMPASLIDDVRLFVTTFVGGLMFMTVYLA